MSGAVRHWLIVSAVACCVTIGAATSPLALRRVDAFHVERVYVEGARFLTPQQAVAASGVTTESTLFDDFEPWRAALLRHPLVVEAHIDRRLPDALVFTIEEAEAIALVATPELRPVDARGQLLPIDPGSHDLDLPVLGGVVQADTSGRIRDAGTLSLLDTLDRLRRAQPWLATWASVIERAQGGGVRLIPRWPAGAEILLPDAPEPDRLEEVRLAVVDLADPAGVMPAAKPSQSRGEASTAEIHRLLRIDARFRDQIVVRLAQASGRTRPRETS